MITEEVKNDKLEIVSLDAGYSVIQVRTATIFKRDGVEINRTFHRRVVNPDADLTGEDDDIVALANTVFTDEVKAAYDSKEV